MANPLNGAFPCKLRVLFSYRVDRSNKFVMTFSDHSHFNKWCASEPDIYVVEQMAIHYDYDSEILEKARSLQIMVFPVVVILLFIIVQYSGTCCSVENPLELLVVMCVKPLDVVIESRVTSRVRTISVPCGHCVECMKRRQNDWKMRITKECESWSHVYFFTLTYKDSKLPCNVCFEDVYDEVLYHGVKPAAELFASTIDGAKVFSTVDFEDVRNWLKRFRTSYERKNDKNGLSNILFVVSMVQILMALNVPIIMVFL